MSAGGAGATSTEDVTFAVALEDLVAAADLLRSVFEASGGTDRYVSVEVSPDLADDSEATIAAGKQLFARADRPNVMIKVPGTPAGLVAVEELIAAGVPVNISLLFSAAHYRGAAEAYLQGIERRLAADQPLPVGSVASVFVSRWDASADSRLPRELHGRTAVAVMQHVLAAYEDVLASERWVHELLEPDTEAAEVVLAAVDAAGVDVEHLATTLQVEGAEAFQASWAKLLDCVGRKSGRLDRAL